ncbi:MAG TPA: hypothetical protein VKY66_04855 [Protaetiibacter sp.]|nr:hypothetical protein [Protaetiibacter sp.]
MEHLTIIYAAARSIFGDLADDIFAGLAHGIGLVGIAVRRRNRRASGASVVVDTTART